MFYGFPYFSLLLWEDKVRAEKKRKQRKMIKDARIRRL